MNVKSGTVAAKIPLLGIFVLNFRYYFFAVRGQFFWFALSSTTGTEPAKKSPQRKKYSKL